MISRRTRVPILLRLAEELRERGSWCGETHLQKAVYFLQEVGEVPLGFDFVLYQHGPFSFDLREELTAVRGAGFLRLSPNPAPYGPSIEVTDVGRRLEKAAAGGLSAVEPAIEFIADHLGAANVLRLEQLSTALMVKREAPALPAERRADRLRTLKPHITEDAAHRAVEEIDSILHEAAVLS
jgi:uncharacterized protein YwgA